MQAWIKSKLLTVDPYRGQVGTHTHGDAARLESIRWLSGEWGKQFLLGGDPSADHTITGRIGDCSGRPV